MSTPGATAPPAEPRHIAADAFDKVARIPIRLIPLNGEGRALSPDTWAVGIGTVETTTVPMPLWDSLRMVEAYGKPCREVFSPRWNAVILMNIRVAGQRGATADRYEALRAYAATTSAAAPTSWRVESYSTHPDFGTWGILIPKVTGALKVSVSPTRDTHITAYLHGDLSPNPAGSTLPGFPTAEPSCLLCVSSLFQEMPEWAARVLDGEPDCTCCS